MNVKLKKISSGDQLKSGCGILGPDYPALDVPLDVALAYVYQEEGKPKVLEGYEIECGLDVASLFGLETEKSKPSRKKKTEIAESTEGENNG